MELIHAYSLIHDDLPAMDDDDLRRGRPTCHKVFGEAIAILAGDALMTLAFLVLARDGALPGGTKARLAMIDTLAWAAGSRGMAGGQALDLDAVGRDIDLTTLENIHIHKTGALIRASVRMACLADPGLAPWPGPGPGGAAGPLRQMPGAGLSDSRRHPRHRGPYRHPGQDQRQGPSPGQGYLPGPHGA